MQLGFFTMPIHPLGRDWRETLREDAIGFRVAERVGYAEAYCGEHVTDAAENITSCMMFLATLAGRTRQIRLGTGTINVPNTHPAAIAGQAAMLDHLLDGRFILGVSPGGLLSDAEAFGSLGRDRPGMFLEGINMVLDIWAKDPPYGLEGQFWKVTTEKTFWPEIGQGTGRNTSRAASAWGGRPIPRTGAWRSPSSSPRMTGSPRTTRPARAAPTGSTTGR